MKFQVVKQSLPVWAIISALGLWAATAQADDKTSAASSATDKDDAAYAWAYDDDAAGSTSATATATPTANIVIFGTSLANQAPVQSVPGDKPKSHPDDSDRHFTDPNDTTLSGT